MSIMYFAVIDTNVLVSALLSRNKDSATVKILDRIVDGIILPVYSTEIIEEYNDVLHRDKFHFSAERVDNLIEGIMYYGIGVTPQEYTEEMLDEDDRIFLSAAYSIRNCCVVTGNLKHFPKLPFVVTPAEMINIIEFS